MKRDDKIDLTDSMLDVVMKMSQGNPGAVTAISKLMGDDPMGILTVLHLDDMGMRGSQIWVAFNDYCKGDVEAFRKAIRERDKGMVAMVNQQCPDRRAVCSGASFA